jgi:hypothetical protein
MKKMKEINSIYTYRAFHYENVGLPFLNKICLEGNSKNIEIGERFWFDYWYCTYNLFAAIHCKYDKFLFL